MTTTEINEVSELLFDAIKTLVISYKAKYPNYIKGRINISLRKEPNPFIYPTKPFGKEWNGYRLCVSYDIHNDWKVEKIIIGSDANQSWKSVCEGEKQTFGNKSPFHSSIFLDNGDKETITDIVCGKLHNLRAESSWGNDKGWKNLSWEVENNTWQAKDSFGFIKSVTFTANPKKEWYALQEWLGKHCGRFVDDKELYRVQIGGKRGRIYGEESERYYLCYYADRCKMFLDKLVNMVADTDKVSLEYKTIDDIDPMDLRISIYQETEFSGYREHCAELTIKDCDGKVKSKIELA